MSICSGEICSGEIVCSNWLIGRLIDLSGGIGMAFPVELIDVDLAEGVAVIRH